MKYMLLIYVNENAMTEPERAQCYKDSTKLADDLNTNGQFLGTNPLRRLPASACARGNGW